MPLWSGILAELSQSAAQGSPPDFDGVRRRCLADLHRHTDALEDDDKLQDLGLSVFHATTHTFAATPAVKVVENHAGRAFIKRHFVAPPAQAVQIELGPKPPAG